VLLGKTFNVSPSFPGFVLGAVLTRTATQMTALDYYKLQEQPFGVTPDSRYVFLTPSHKEALNSLVYGIESGCGFVALIADPGLGKTTLLYQTLDILRDNARIVFLFQTISTPLDLLRALLSGLGVRELRGNLVEMQILLKELLSEQYRAGKRVVLVVDEAQNLDDSVLELVRMLSNFETERDKLIQIVLAGQPGLEKNIASPELVQLRQRVSIFARLKPLTPEETTLYIAHRLRTAGYSFDTPLFTKDALAIIALCSEGIPRNINNLCFNALSLGSALQQRPIDRDILRQVIADLDLGPLRKKFSLPPPPPEEKVTPVLTSELFWAQESPSVFAEWLPKIAAALLVVLTIGGAVFAARHWLGQPASSHASVATPASQAPEASQPPAGVAAAPEAPINSVPPATASPALGQPSSSASALPPAAPAMQTNRPGSPSLPQTTTLGSANTPPSTGSAGTVRVKIGQTLLGICTEQFGTCTPELLQQIHELNPLLKDPDHIEIGQDLRIPVLAAQSSVDPRKNASGSHE
jgi:general secretion pathway protein A